MKDAIFNSASLTLNKELPIALNDSRWNVVNGWVKMQRVIEVNGKSINIHFVKNKITGEVDDFKFVD